MGKLKLTAKLALLACLTIISIALTFTFVAATSINQLAVSQSKRMMSVEVGAILERMKEAQDQMVDSGVGDIKSFLQNTQTEFLAGLKNYNFGEYGRLYILGENDQILLAGEGRGTKDFKPEDMKRFLAHPSGVVEAEVGGRASFVALGIFKQWGWRFALVVPDLEINAARNEFLAKALMIVVASMLFCVPLFVWVATRFVRPLRVLSAQISAMTAEKLGDRIDIGADPGSEVAELHQAVILMTERLQDAINKKENG